MIYYTDGYCIGMNPSPTGGGFTIFNEHNELVKTVRIEKTRFTNNEAELLGIVESLRIAGKHDTIVTDSQICLGWVLRGNTKSRHDLAPIAQEGLKLLIAKQVFLAWQPREV